MPSPRQTFAVRKMAVGFALVGLPFGLLGVSWPSARQALHRADGSLGVLLAVMSMAYAFGGLATARLVRRFGAGAVLRGGAGLAALGLAAMGAAPHWLVYLAAVVPVGFAGGAVDTGLNIEASAVGDVGLSNMLHGFFAVGATLGPLVIAGLDKLGMSWRLAFGLLAAGDALVSWWFRGLGDRRGEPHEGADAATVVDAADRPAGPRRPTPARVGAMTALVVATFLFYVSIESTSGQWSASLLEGRGFHSIPRALWVGSFWAAFTVGRFAAGVVGNRWRFRTFLDVSALVLVVGLLWLWWSPTPVLGAIGLPLLGLAMASIFPTMVTLMPERVESDRAPVVMGYAIAAAATGGTIVPIIVGALRDRGSTEVIIPVMAVCTAVMIVLELSLRQVERGAARHPAPAVPPVGVEP